MSELERTISKLTKMPIAIPRYPRGKKKEYTDFELEFKDTYNQIRGMQKREQAYFDWVERQTVVHWENPDWEVKGAEHYRALVEEAKIYYRNLRKGGQKKEWAFDYATKRVSLLFSLLQKKKDKVGTLYVNQCFMVQHGYDHRDYFVEEAN